jgi:hypothetical protein
MCPPMEPGFPIIAATGSALRHSLERISRSSTERMRGAGAIMLPAPALDADYEAAKANAVEWKAGALPEYRELDAQRRALRHARQTAGMSRPTRVASHQHRGLWRALSKG